MYPTRRMISVALLGFPVSVAIAVVSPQLWFLGVVWVFIAIGLFALDMLLSASPAALTFTLNMPRAIAISDREDVRVRMAFARHPPGFVEFAADTGELLLIEPARQTCVVTSGNAVAGLSLIPRRRGEGVIEMLWARWQGPLGLCWRQCTKSISDTIAIIPNIGTVKDEAVKLFQRDSDRLGLRAQLRSGEGSEFSALREFLSGMDRRAIDWKQTAKHGKLLSREYQAEENLRIVFALDTGRLMCEPLLGLPRIDRAIQSLLLLSYVALRLGDRVGIFAFDEKPALDSKTVAGPNAFGVIQRLAARLDYSTAETNFTLGLSQLYASLQQRSIVIVFTDFSDTTSAELMLENVKRLSARHRVLFVSFRDEELENMARSEPHDPADISRAVLANAMLLERGAVTTRLRRLGIDVVDAPVERISMELVESYLVLKHSGL